MRFHKDPSPVNCLRPFYGWTVSLFFLLFHLLGPTDAWAYIGPGAGFAFLGSFFAIFLTFLLAFLALFAWPFRYLLRRLRRKPSQGKGRTIEKAIVVGFDGMEPSLVKRYMDRGFLPNFSRLKSEGTYRPLKSTLPPLSPVAWSTFQTGVNPGKHGIFDFLHRNPKNYLGELSSAQIQANPKSLKIGNVQIPLGKPIIRLLRKSQPFWKILGEHDIFSMILRVPITFPPERFQGMSLAAMCAPDLRGTQGTFSYYTTRTVPEEKKTGGEVIPLTWQGDTVRTWVLGPPHPFRSRANPLKTALTIKQNGRKLRLRLNGENHDLSPGEFTPWIPVAFRADLLKIRGIVRFYLRGLDPSLDLYMSPVQIDPASPSLPISHPAAYSVYLAKKQGSYATLGLAEDTWALNEGVLDDRAFWDQCWEIHREREIMFWDALEHLRSGLLVCVFDITDRVQHMFWRYEDKRHPAHPSSPPAGLEDPFLQVYKKADAFLGKLLDRVDSDTLLFVMSDHGFRSFRRCVNINTWLHQNGLLSIREEETSEDWFQGVEWSETKAFAVGLAGIYINQKGRERSGVVSPGEETDRIKEQIIQKLKGLKDPETGETAILDVVDTQQAYQGPYTTNAPDLIVAYSEGYRNAWESAVGKVTGEIFYDNKKSWSGDHCMLPNRVPGVLFCNRKLERGATGIVDLAPTILKGFGIDPPPYMDGRALSFDSMPSERERNVENRDQASGDEVPT